MYSNTTVLLTGATGFIGSNLLQALIEEGFKVAILKQPNSCTDRINSLLDKVTIFEYTQGKLDKVFEEMPVDIIIHLATHYLKQDDEEQQQMYKSNVDFPSELLESGCKHGLKGFINTGTFFEYDCATQPVNESAKLEPFNYYAYTKTVFESRLAGYADKLLINTFRLFSPYGEHDNQKLIPFIIQKNLKGEFFKLSEGLQKIDLVYVRDIVSAYLKAIHRMRGSTEKSEYEVFNLGSGHPLSIRDIVSIVEQTTGMSCDNQWGEPAKLEIPVAYADINKVKAILGWKPQYTVFTGIAKTVKFYRDRVDG